ncbi:thioredoxin domain-containing protein YyaL [Desulfuromonas soudanensis]|uniref:Thioredoxin domain-containing protein YyaL n=1 Tax=Desulfuromonas soudanensis TaxID=1603606 RepID=A0A0M4DHG4_9BACT|nr:thioredoxin domain-containing protein [Desulfuromonas soudanensis]ALC16232.1 thioredoxin domain-containing protein YyaL [Desulfuromonas soudanensis]
MKPRHPAPPVPPSGEKKRANRLAGSLSPYLLQHAANPVDWYPWGEEAFARAQEEDRPVFLSVGYSTCHWCHVMAHESFENEEVAALLNRHFVAIKVDREERPDLDHTYMTACQMLSGSGGWPTTLVLTPDKKPFFAATYLPPRSRGGMTGLMEILQKIAELWQQDRHRLLQTGSEVERALLDLESDAPSPGLLQEDLLRRAFEGYLADFDRAQGGFGSAPKFPAPHNLSLLLRLAKRFGEERATTMALQTLQQIRLGGIFDQVGFGLHRYSVDANWLVPHFEKMLYDQALAVIAFLDAYQASGAPFFRQSALEILEYVQRELSDPEGGFYCGEDADSEGKEGTYYLWSPEEVEAILGRELSAVFCRCYGIAAGGNFEGRSIPHLAEDVETLARKAGVDPQDLAALLGEGRKKLLEARSKRVHPHRDDKILSGWNGLIIAALARAGAVLDLPHLLETAQRGADFIVQRLRDETGRLLRTYRAGTAAIPAFLEDYAFVTWGLLELYQGGFDRRHLDGALELTGAMEELFADGQGGYYDTAADAEHALVRGRSLQDGALPSGVSVVALNLLRLGRLCGDLQLEARGERLLALALPKVERAPTAYAQSLIALDYALGPKSEVALTPSGEGDPPQELLAVLRSTFLPRTLLLVDRPGEEHNPLPLLLGKTPLEGRPTAYLCRERTCLPPVTRGEELREILKDC